MKKVIFFTTCNNPNNLENEIIFRAAFSSWQKLNLEVVIYTEEEIFQFDDEFNFIIEKNFKKDKIFGLPLVKSIFEETYKNYDRDVYVFLNSDILLEKKFLEIIQKINLDEFLLIGRRIDVFGAPKINYLTQSKDEIEKLLSNCDSEIHSILGIDYFAFSKNYWNLKKMPNFMIARARFDHWLIGFAKSIKKPVIDISDVWKPLHLERNNRIQFYWTELWKKNKKMFFQFLKNRIIFGFSRFSGNIDSSNYILSLKNDKYQITKKPISN
jgi:hypothetical protein